MYNKIGDERGRAAAGGDGKKSNLAQDDTKKREYYTVIPSLHS